MEKVEENLERMRVNSWRHLEGKVEANLERTGVGSWRRLAGKVEAKSTGPPSCRTKELTNKEQYL